MTPHFPKPSAHSVITGFFTPNEKDVNRGLGNNFGTTITMMAQDFAKSEASSFECWTDTQRETEQALLRAHLFDYFSSYLGLVKESSESTSCATKLSTYEGHGDLPSFWDWNWSNRCQLVNYETQWSVYNIDDYKRCVCFFWSHRPENDCAQNPRPKQCTWNLGEQPNETKSVKVRVPVAQLGDEVEVVPHNLLQGKMNFPKCQEIPTEN